MSRLSGTVPWRPLALRRLHQTLGMVHKVTRSYLRHLRAIAAKSITILSPLTLLFCPSPYTLNQPTLFYPATMRSAVLFAVFTAIFSSVAVIATPMQITQDELLARSIPSALDIDPIKRAINAPLTNGERLAR